MNGNTVRSETGGAVKVELDIIMGKIDDLQNLICEIDTRAKNIKNVPLPISIGSDSSEPTPAPTDASGKMMARLNYLIFVASSARECLRAFI